MSDNKPLIPPVSLWPWTETVESRGPLCQEARQCGESQGLTSHDSPQVARKLWRKGIQFCHILSFLTKPKFSPVAEEARGSIVQDVEASVSGMCCFTPLQ